MTKETDTRCTSKCDIKPLQRAQRADSPTPKDRCLYEVEDVRKVVFALTSFSSMLLFCSLILTIVFTRLFLAWNVTISKVKAGTRLPR